MLWSYVRKAISVRFRIQQIEISTPFSGINIFYDIGFHKVYISLTRMCLKLTISEYKLSISLVFLVLDIEEIKNT